MCGIAGYIGKAPLEKSQILRTLGLMKRRGPDDQGYLSFQDGPLFVSLLHSRLSIIDVDKRANQPFTLSDRHLVFNGEIYNYLELRKQLEQRGDRFTTQSDTEVLLRAYLAKGISSVNDFEGMWSFAIYDRSQQKLWFSRDRFGEKPLYWYRMAEGIFFGSEIKFIRSLANASLCLNEQQLMRYLVNGYKSLYKRPGTFFKGIQEVPSGSCLSIDSQLNTETQRYWTLNYKPASMSLPEAIGGFQNRLLESVHLRLRADVPVSFCLSGGVDSGAIVSIASKIFGYRVSTYSIIDEDERYNETRNIQQSVDDLKCGHKILRISKDQTLNRLKRLIEYHDAPISTVSYYIHSFLSEAISKDGYKVVLSGTGADELVTGYYDHFHWHLLEMQKEGKHHQHLQDWERLIKPHVRNPYLQKPDLFLGNPSFRGHIYLNRDVFASFLEREFREEFEEEIFCESPLRNRMLNELFYESVPVILHEDDLNSMFFSIENRSPYLDSRLSEFAFTIPNEYLIREGYGKYILREAVKGILNEPVRLDHQKKGFNASIHSVLDLDLKEVQDYLLEDSPIYDLVKKEKIQGLLWQKQMPNSYGKFLFNFVNAKMFLELFSQEPVRV